MGRCVCANWVFVIYAENSVLARRGLANVCAEVMKVIHVSTAHFARIGAIVVFALTTQAEISQQANTTKQVERREIPWYVKAAAIHRVTLKPATRFWRFEHLSLH